MEYGCYIWAIIQALIAEIVSTESSQVMKTVYHVEYDFAIMRLPTIGVKEGVMSVVECARQCATEENCGNANYHVTKFQCDLLAHASSLIILEDKKNITVALMGWEYLQNMSGNLPATSIPQSSIVKRQNGQVAFWPLNEKTKGENILQNSSHFVLHNVTYANVANQWYYPPVRFTTPSSSYAEIAGSTEMAATGSFSWMAAVYREQNENGPLFEWTAANHMTHIWVLNNALYFSLYLTCATIGEFHDVTQVPGRWYTLAVAFDASAGILSMWTDGQLKQVSTPCAGPTATTPKVYINKRINIPSIGFTGYVTCMSFYTGVKTYEEMYQVTMPVCKPLD